MIRSALLLALLAAPVAAQAPPPGTRQVKLDVSPAGQAVLRKYMGGRDPAINERAQRIRAIAQQMGALSNAPRLDLVRLQALMRQQEALQADLQRRANDRTLAMLRELSEADRVKFLRGFRAAQAAAKPPGQ